jgi:hypothetical protein
MGDRRHILLRFLQGVVIAMAAGLIILRFIALDAVSHSASDTLRPWFIQAGFIALAAFGLVVALDRIAARAER